MSEKKLSDNDIGELEKKIKTLTTLLSKTHETVQMAIGLELEYGDYSAALKYKELKSLIEKEIETD